MRLLNTTTLELRFFAGDVPPYVILSHRWEEEEVTFADVMDETARQMQGYDKLASAARESKRLGYDHVWIDTCCIDKSSSAELSEAINSMFRWYSASATCIVYLSDVETVDDIGESKWFTRGWTLQELVAPRQMSFLNKDWEFLGSKESLKDTLRRATGISEEVLLGADLARIPACNKMSWASKRVTTRPEDVAYCLMGLFNVNMPLMYGEGQEKAFKRLQGKFLKESGDESILAWMTTPEEAKEKQFWGLLASSPSYFEAAGGYTIPRFKAFRQGLSAENTSNGLSAPLILHRVESDETGTIFTAALNCEYKSDEPDNPENTFNITLQKLSDFEGQYARVRPDFILPHKPAPGAAEPSESKVQQIFVRSKPRVSEPVAGFWIDEPKKIPFTFVAGSPKGHVDIPGNVYATFGDGDKAIIKPPPKSHVLEVSEAEGRVGVGAFEVDNLTDKLIVGCVEVKLDSWLEGQPPYTTQMRRPDSYRNPYLVVGFEPLKENGLGTRPGFVVPWYTFMNAENESLAMEACTSPTASQYLKHRAPGGVNLRVRFKPGTFRFRTYYSIELVNMDEEKA